MELYEECGISPNKIVEKVLEIKSQKSNKIVNKASIN
jgi:hypothetical protein